MPSHRAFKLLLSIYAYQKQYKTGIQFVAKHLKHQNLMSFKV